MPCLGDSKAFYAAVVLGSCVLACPVGAADLRLPVSGVETSSGRFPDWRENLSGGGVKAALPGVPQPVSDAIAVPARAAPYIDRNVLPKLLGGPVLSDSNAPASLASSPDIAERIRAASVEIKGDADLLEKLRLRRPMEQALSGKSLATREILAVLDNCRQDCVKAGYYLATVKLASEAPPGKIVVLVDKGRVGNIALYEGGFAGDHREPFAQRYFSEAHIRRMLRRVRPGGDFDYNDFYAALFGINAHPDITLDADLRIRRETADGMTRRYADVDFMVRESRPLHGVLEIRNSGTRETGAWRLSGTLQHLNLTRNGDSLTVNALASTDFKSLLSLAAGYNFPFQAGNGGSLTVYGGYSSVEADEIVPVIDLIGSGWFACLQASYDVVSTRSHLVTVSAAATRRRIESTITMRTDVDFDDCESAGSSTTSSTEETRGITILPATFSVSYSSARPDRLGGRNFLTCQSSLNLGGTLGSSGAEELSTQRAGATDGYFVERIQAARLQPLFGTRIDNVPVRGQWLFFMKADAQVTSAALVPAEQKSAGGMDSVRGYPEREALGDKGVSCTVEMRSPIFSLRLPGDKGDDSTPGKVTDHWQVIVFADAGRVSLNQPVEGSPDSVTLAGAGLGLRLALSAHSQLKFDWGFPLKETANSSAGGQGHLSLQAQF